MRFLASLETKAASTAIRRASAGQPFLMRSFPYLTRWSVQRAVTDGYERVIWVFRAIDAVASNASSKPIVFRKGSEQGEIMAAKHELLDLLNRRANSYETGAAFRYRLSTQLLLSKQGVFVELVRDSSGKLQELHLLPPDRTAPIPDPKKFVSGYRVTYADGGWEDLKPERVLWIKKPHPTDPYMGVTPMEAAGLSIDMDFYARLYNRNFMLNDGRPGGLITVKGQLNQQDAEEIKRRFSGGPQQAGRATVIEADDVSWVDTATSPRDAQYAQSITITKEDILLAFGTPESVLGNASGRTYDNADAEENVFWRATMVPHCDLIAAAFDSLVEDEQVYVAHDLSGVQVLQRDEKERASQAKAEWEAGLITIDEYREATGKEPLGLPGTKVLWLKPGQTPIGEDADVQALQEQAQAAMGGGAPAPAELPPGAAGELEAAPVDADDVPVDAELVWDDDEYKGLRPADFTDDELMEVIRLGAKALEDERRAGRAPRRRFRVLS